MAPFVKKVVTTVKAGGVVELSRKTLIVGVSGSGKSTIVNAVELALSGRASDIAGRRTLALDAELWTLAPPGHEAIMARVELDDGRHAEWRLEKGHKAARSGDVGDSILGAPFPLRDVQENLTGSAETARKWLLGQVSRETPWTNVLAMIPGTFHAKVSTLAGSNVFGLATALETARSQAREADASAKALREQAREQSASLPPPPTEEEATAAKVTANAELQKAVEEGEGRLAAARKAHEQAQARLDTARAKFESLPSADASVVETGGAMLAVLRAAIASGAKSCGICRGALDAAAAKARLDVLQKRIAGEQSAAKAKADAEATVRTCTAMREEATRVVTATVEEVARLRALLQIAPEPPEVASRRTAWQSVTDLEAKATGFERDALSWRELGGVLDTVMKRVVEQARLGFEGKVQAFLPATDTFGFDLRDGDRDVVRFGLRMRYEVPGKDGPETHTFLKSALSGAEWARVTAAIAAAVTPAGAFAVVSPEDRPMDPKTLSAVLVAFGNVHAQVIVCSPILPEGPLPSGWTLVRTGEAGTVGRPPIEMVTGGTIPRARKGARRKALAPDSPDDPPPAPAKRTTPKDALSLLFDEEEPIEVPPEPEHERAPAPPAPKPPSIFDD